MPDDIINLDDFECLRCGCCCQWPGPVKLAGDEPDIIAAHLGMDVKDFIEKYTRLTWNRKGLSLTEKEDGACIFYEGDPPSCAINPVKPAQCRNFPHGWKCAQEWMDHCKGMSKLRKK